MRGGRLRFRSASCCCLVSLRFVHISDVCNGWNVMMFLSSMEQFQKNVSKYIIHPQKNLAETRERKTRYYNFGISCCIFFNTCLNVVYDFLYFGNQTFAKFSQKRIHVSMIHNFIGTFHYNDLMMSELASQIIGVPMACSAVCSGVYQMIKANIKAPRYWPLVRGFTGDRWIPLTKGQ